MITETNAQMIISQEEISDFLKYKMLSPRLSAMLKNLTEQDPQLSKLEALEMLLDYLDN